MIFNSIQYLLFLPIVTLLYFLLPVRFRWAMLLAASCYFYMFFVPVYILILAATIIVDYAAGILIENAPKERKKPYLVMSLVANIGVLCIFKYYNFFIENVEDLMAGFGIHHNYPYLTILLPIGLSFHTFQAMSYTLEVYKGQQKAERHFGIYALYVMFFPQLVAGPIEKPQHLLSQFHFNYDFSWPRCVSGLRIILMGLFKKVVVADQLGSMISHVFDNAYEAHSLSIYLASMLFVIQVYCDFSGYSDIARGSARILGVDLLENFNLPFFANSFSSFWAKWHVSLMNWFRDYVMFPLIRKRWKWPFVFMLVFMISGFWHGANWTFIVWGAVNGLLVIYTKATADWRKKFLNNIGLKPYANTRHVIQSVIVFHMFASTAVFFRAHNIRESFVLIRGVFTDMGKSVRMALLNENNMRQDILYLGNDFMTFAVILTFCALLFFFEWGLRKQTLDERLQRMPLAMRMSLYLFVVFSVVLMSNVAEAPFIYFQF